MPSLKPNRLRGVACAGRRRRGPAETELRPADRRAAEGDPGQVADRRARRPAGRRRRPGRTGRRRTWPGRGCPPGSAAAAAGPRAGARPGRTGPCRSSRNRDGPKPNVMVSPAAAARSPRRCRPAGRRTARRSGPNSPAPWPCGHPGRGGGPVLQQRDQLVARVGDHVEGGEVQSVLSRRDDAGLVRAVEGVGRRPGGAATAAGSGWSSANPPATPAATPSQPGAGRAQQPAPGDPSAAAPEQAAERR